MLKYCKNVTVSIISTQLRCNMDPWNAYKYVKGADRAYSQEDIVDCETRKKILDISLMLFSEHGYDATPISKIADEAGVAKSLIYHYFKKKSDILDELFDEYFNVLKRMKSVLKSSDADSEEGIDSVFSELFKREMEYSERYLKLFYSEMGKNKAVRDRFSDFLRKMTEGINADKKCHGVNLERRRFVFLMMFLTPFMSYYSMSEMYQDVLGMSDAEIKDHFRDFFVQMRKKKKGGR